MIARLSLSVLLAACVAWPSALFAQWNSPGEYQMGGYAPPPGPPGPVGHPGAPHFAGGYAPQPGVDYYGDGSGFNASLYQPQPLPWERDGRTPFRQFMTEVMPNTYFRVEYLSWDVSDVGARPLGAGTLLTPDVRRPIPFGQFNLDTFTGRDLIVPTTEPISFDKTSGLRATWGIPLTFGTAEFSAFALKKNEDGLLNAIPGLSSSRDFRVPDDTFLFVPPTVPVLFFPVGTVVTPIPTTLSRIFSPPPIIPGAPVTLLTFFGDVLAPGSIFSVPTTTAVGIPLLQNGAPGFAALIYDVAYSASYRSDVWGTEAKLIIDSGPNHNGMTLKPLVGFRYMSFDERFRQVGVSSFASNIVRDGGTLFTSGDALFLPIGQPGTIAGAPRTSVIDSRVENNLYGLQLGTRAEYEHRWFTVGVEPRVSLGLNHYEAEVTTTNLRNDNDGRRRTRDKALIFAPVFDATMYGKVHLTPYFSLHAGFNYTYLARVTRPVRNIVYNDNGPDARPGVVVDARREDVTIQGLTIGGEFSFRDLKFR